MTASSRVAPPAPRLIADLDHIALTTTLDPLRLVDFYVTTIGFAPVNVAEYKARMVPFPSVRASGTTILDFFAASDEKGNEREEGLRNGSHFCFAVPRGDWEQLRDRLRRNGLEIRVPNEKRSGARGDGVSLYVDDPDGNVVEFRYYEPEDGERGGAGTHN